MRRIMFISVVVISYIDAQQVQTSTYTDILRNTLGLPRDMRGEIVKQSGGSLSQSGEKMMFYQPVVRVEIQSGAVIMANILPKDILLTLPFQFMEQLKELMSTYGSYDGPNQLGLAIEGYNIAADYEEYSVSNAKAVIAMIGKDGARETRTKENFDVSAVAIAPKSNSIIAYAGIQEGQKNHDIYWADLSKNKEIKVGTLDTPIQRLQFCTEKILYALSNKRLYLFDLNEPGKMGIDQLFKDAEGKVISIEDFSINKMYPNYAIAVMNQGLYLLDLVTKKSKLLDKLMPGSSYKTAFFDSYIATLIANVANPSILNIGTLTIFNTNI